MLARPRLCVCRSTHFGREMDLFLQVFPEFVLPVKWLSTTQISYQLE